jgi:YVTN family beta-propeller protein
MHSHFQTVPFCLSLLALATNFSNLSSPDVLVIVNQAEHSVLLVDLKTRTTIATIKVGLNGHEVAISPDARYAYIPIYGDSAVGRPGTDGSTIDIIDLRERKLAGTIDLGKPVRPHCAKFGPDGLLYVTAELSNAVFAVDTKTRKVVAEIPTGQIESHMLVITSDGRRAYTANVHVGSISVLDLQKRSVVKTISIAKQIQRVSLSPDGRQVFTHDQDSPRIAVIDTAKNEIANWLDLPAPVYSSAPTPDGRWLLANSSAGKLFVWDLVAGKLARTFDIPPAVGEIALSADGAIAFISCPQAGSVQVLNLATWKMEDPLIFTKGVDGIAVLNHAN